MAQFDLLIIFTLLWSLIFILFFYYNMSIETLIPNFSGTRKFREKKLNLLSASFELLKNILEVKNNKFFNNIIGY
jgi:predicted membrane protein